jgi:DNA-binding MarR family transcriptional regulator
MSSEVTPDTPNPALLLDNQLCFALYSASLAMTKLYKPILKELGLTYPQYLVMLVLWEQEGISVSDLGARLYLDSGTLTPLLKRLQAAGLLERQRGVADERRVQIVLTAAGRALRPKAAAVPPCVLKAVDCPVSEVRDLTRQMQQLRSKLLA